MSQLLKRLLPLQRGERLLTLVLFVHSLLAVGVFLAGRTVRDALFLANCDRALLGWMYVASAAVVTSAGFLYTYLSTRFRRDVMALCTASLCACCFVVFWAFDRMSLGTWIYVVLYVFVEVMGSLVLVQFWTLANELFDARDAKRLYGFIAAGGTVSNILIGLLAARVAMHFGAASLLLVCAALLGGATVTSSICGYLGRQRLFAHATTGVFVAPKRSRGGQRILGDSHLQAVALLTLVMFFTTTIIDFEFKVIAADKVPSHQLAVFFGHFSAIVGAFALGLQLFGTSRLLNRIGVIATLAVLPVSLAFGSAALVLIPALWTASLTKGADVMFRYSLNDVTTQILYMSVPVQIRVAAKAFIDGAVKPIAIGLAGIALVAYRLLWDGNPYRLAWVSLAFSGGWLALVLALRSKYLQSLHRNLKHRRLRLGVARHQVVDDNTRAVLELALASKDEQEVCNALALLPQLETVQLERHVVALLQHPAARIREKVLEYYAYKPTAQLAPQVLRCLEDSDALVRAAAIRAYCAIRHEKAVPDVRHFLVDDDLRVRSSAIKGIAHFGGLDGILEAAAGLKHLIASPVAEMRQQAAQALGAIGIRHFYRPLLALMNDEDFKVRRDAIVAIGTLQNPECAMPLIYRKQPQKTVLEATQALTAYGVYIIPMLRKALTLPAEDEYVYQTIVRVLGRLRVSSAIEVIVQHLGLGGEELHGNMYRAIARATVGRHVVLQDLQPIRVALGRELEGAYRALHFAHILQLDTGIGHDTPHAGLAAAKVLLGSALQEKVARAERRIFLLLAVMYPDADMERIVAGIYETSEPNALQRRSNAVELLDNLLERDLKIRFQPLLERLHRAECLARVASLYPAPQLLPHDVLRELTRDESAWVRACAVWHLAEGGSMLIEQALQDSSPIVREIALVSLTSRSPERARALATEGLQDDAPFVRRQAQHILRQLKFNES